MFSVIVPVYNKRPYVARAIASVLAQSFLDFELLLVDDNSTDGSGEEIARFADPRIRTFRRHENGPGGYAARNFGIGEARADWVAFLDADDEWMPDHLQNAAGALRAQPTTSLYSSSWEISDGRSRARDAYSRDNADAQVFGLREFLRGPVPIWTSVAVVRRDLLNRVGGFDESWKHGADIDLWLRLMLEGAHIAWSPTVGAIYHRDATNRVSSRQFQETSPTTRTIRRFLTLSRDLAASDRAALVEWGNSREVFAVLRGIASREMPMNQIREQLFWNELSTHVRVWLLAYRALPLLIRSRIPTRWFGRLL